MTVCVVVFAGSNFAPVIGSGPVGITFQETGTAPTQYSTVLAEVRRPDEGRNEAGVVFTGFCATGFAGAAPDGKTTRSARAAVAAAAAASAATAATPRLRTITNPSSTSL